MKKEMKKNGFLHVLANLDLYATSICLIILIAITFMGVIFRYVIGSPLTWLEEVQLALLVWIGFLSGGAAFRTGSHIAIEMVVELFPQKVQMVIAWFVRVIVFGILVYLTIQCTAYMMNFVSSGKLTPVLRIPYAYIYAAPALACAIMIVSYVWYEVTGGKKEDTEEEESYE